MNKILFLITTLLVFNACSNNSCNKSNIKQQVFKSENKVYICTGNQSYRYHKTEYCIGLSKCSQSIEEWSMEEAKRLGRTPCRLCYQ